MVKCNNLLWVAVLCAAVALTNRYTDLDWDKELIGRAAGDSYSYYDLAESAPGLPHDTLAFHHAQRIAIPYFVGTIHRLVPIPIHRLFQVSVFLFEVSILLVVAGILRILAVESRVRLMLLAMLALNPWAFRLYVTFPELVNDLGFVLGLAIVLRGLFEGKRWTVVAGQLIASLSRQTGLLLVPFVILWIWTDVRDWGRQKARERVLSCVIVATTSVGVYLLTGSIAGRFSASSVNADHLLGFATWFANDFDPIVLGSVLIRMLASVAIPLACFVGIVCYTKGVRPVSRLCPILLFGSVCCWVQPVLAGPGITGGNGGRLIGLGLVPLVIALAIKMRDAGVGATLSLPRLSAIVTILALCSLHHLYVSPHVMHPVERNTFAVLYTLGCASMFLLLYHYNDT